MTEKEIQNTTIKEYINLLKLGSDPGKCNQITEWLNSKCGSDSIDLNLLQLQINRILFTGKLAKLSLNFEMSEVEKQEKRQIYLNKFEEINEQLDRLQKKDTGEKKDPYTSFLNWLLGLKKYYGSEVDRNGDLVELVQATEQMMTSIKVQEQQLIKRK